MHLASAVSLLALHFPLLSQAVLLLGTQSLLRVPSVPGGSLPLTEHARAPGAVYVYVHRDHTLSAPIKEGQVL